MSFIQLNHSFSNNQKCEVCDARLSHAELLQLKDLDYVVCQSFDCRHIMEKKSKTPPLVFQSLIQSQRQQVKERKAKDAARKKHIEEASERENDENLHIYRSILSSNPDLSENEVDLLAIPSGLSRLIPLSSDRIDAYSEHLENIITEAYEYLENPDIEIDHHLDTHEKMNAVEDKLANNIKVRNICDHMCGMCKGGCCTSGKNSAYLSAINIVRYVKTNPDITATEMLKLYLSKIPEKSIAGACINQTENGCALPKALRSDTCSSFYCESLRIFQENKTDKTLDNVLAIQRSGTCWNRFGSGVENKIVDIALVSENGVQPLKINHQDNVASHTENDYESDV